jgi:hypothetical protein
MTQQSCKNCLNYSGCIWKTKKNMFKKVMKDNIAKFCADYKIN